VTVNTQYGPLRMVGNPIKLQSVTTLYAPPPLLGEHSEEIRARFPKTDAT
jgi:crotonobetainyl-CoA:carnitine CoA-transferase CaiB-like acyl-CoA transferase